MNKLCENILEYKNKNNLTIEQCSQKLGISMEDITNIDNKQEVFFDKSEESRINKLLGKSTGKKIVKCMDLIFRFVAMVMSLVTLLLCINENIEPKVLIVLLSISLVCSSMTILPKIEK